MLGFLFSGCCCGGYDSKCLVNRGIKWHHVGKNTSCFLMRDSPLNSVRINQPAAHVIRSEEVFSASQFTCSYRAQVLFGDVLLCGRGFLLERCCCLYLEGM